MVKAALAAGANARAVTGRDNGSALITAAQPGFVDIVRALIEAKADIDHVNGRGWTALITTVVLGNGSKPHIDTVEALVAAGADGDIKDRQGKTATVIPRPRLQRHGAHPGEGGRPAILNSGLPDRIWAPPGT